MKIGNDSITLSSTDMSANITSDLIDLSNIINYSIQLVFTGSPVGAFKLQASNDLGRPSAPQEADRDFGVSNWTDIVASTVSVSAAGNIMYNAENVGYKWIRIVYTFTSGTGTLTSARFNKKGI